MGLKHLLAETCFAVSNATFDAVSLQALAPTAAPCLFILDGSPGSRETVEFIQNVKAQCPTARVVVLADHFERDTVIMGHAAGADGFCLTSTEREVLIKSLELIMLGETVVPRDMVLSLLQAVSHRPQPQEHGVLPSEDTFAIAPGTRKLSTREAEILRCLTEGAPNKVIARKLDVAEATVKVHIKAILRKVGAANRTQAAIWGSAHMTAASKVNAAV
jgi:two-component system nitrate/nitrite response regulator NarL